MAARIKASAGRRILIIVENLSVPFDRRVWQEATTLRQAGYEISVICPRMPGYEKAREVLDGIHIYRHPLPFEADRPLGFVLEYALAFFWEFVLTWRIFLGRGFDAIHACNPPDTIFLIGLFFKALFGRRFVFDHHDINPELFEAKFGGRGFLYRVVVALERCSFRVADISIATNESYRRIAIERGGMSEERVFVVRSGPDLDRLRIVGPVASLKAGRRYLVGYVGTMGRQEGISYLLEAARFIIYEMGRQDIHFRIVGGGPELDRLKLLAVEHEISDYVTFTGRVSDEELLEALATADVCVNPDEYNEMNDKSTMNKIMEYMAAGKPVVQFDLTEGRFTAQEASLYAEPNNAVDLARRIVELIDDPQRRESMGRIGRNRVENALAWRFEAPKLLRAYETLWE